MFSKPLSLRLIKEIHKELLKGVRGGDRTPGEFRKTQNWIGPPGSSISDATSIPPPPHQLMDALGNLEKFIHEKGVTPNF